MLPRSFRPDGTYELIRLGNPDQDAGYLVDPASVAEAGSLVSGGLGLDWSFERDFIQQNDVPLLAYDNTISLSRIQQRILKYTWALRPQKTFETILTLVDYITFFRHPRTHLRLNVGLDSDSGHSMRSIFEQAPPPPVFIKMDIESSEYRILDELVKHASHISGLVVEFHDVDLHREKIAHFIDTFPLKLIHIHSANSFRITDAHGDPLTLEITFAANPTRVAEAPTLPHPLDRDSNPQFPSLPMSFE